MTAILIPVEMVVLVWMAWIHFLVDVTLITMAISASSRKLVSHYNYLFTHCIGLDTPGLRSK